MRKRILFVEDDQSLLFLYRRVFSRMGYDVRTAVDGDQALEVVREEPPDVVVLDVKLAGPKDGLQVLREILKLRRIPAIINTAYARFRETFASRSADAYVLKSSDLTELSDTVDRLLTGRVLAEPLTATA